MRRSCHEKMIGLFIPFDQKWSADLLYRYFTVTSSGQNRCHYRSSASGSTTYRLTGSALPLTDLQIIPAHKLRKSNIRFIRENGCHIFNLFSVFFHVKLCHRIDKHCTVRISPGNRSNVKGTVKHLYRLVDKCIHFCVDWDHFCGKSRFPDICPDVRYITVCHCQCQMLHAAQSLDHKLCLIGQSVVVHVFSDTAQCISTHLAFRSVRVKHAHAEIPFI